MINQAGGDAGNNWLRQLFVGQIPGDWNRGKLEKYLADSLKISENDIQTEIQFDHVATLEKTQSNQQKKIAFIRFKSENYHNKALKKETFNESDVKLNIKESNQENEKRKLFFGRLSDDITKEKVSEMIDLICPGYEKHIEDDFPQVPEQNQGKSRIAFVLFKTHQAAHDVKEGFKKLLEPDNRSCKPEVIELLKSRSHNGNDIRDLIAAVDYHKRTGKMEEDRSPSSLAGNYFATKKASDAGTHQYSVKAGPKKDGCFDIHLRSCVYDQMMDAHISLSLLDLQRTKHHVEFGKGSSANIEFSPQLTINVPPFTPGMYGGNALASPPGNHSINNLRAAQSENFHQMSHRQRPGGNNYTYMYGGFGGNPTHVNSRNLRRNQSSTGPVQTRSAPHNNLAATRSESVLHR